MKTQSRKFQVGDLVVVLGNTKAVANLHFIPKDEIDRLKDGVCEVVKCGESKFDDVGYDYEIRTVNETTNKEWWLYEEYLRGVNIENDPEVFI